MPADVVELDRVSKRYVLGEQHTTLREAMTAWARRPLQREHRPRETIWSLRDVSLRVAEGEVVGFVGRNGAGKSTLLKIVTRITEPTSGVSRTRGRVGSLLEVGTGFHPELTGRENVFLNGAILGIAKREISRRFEEIVEFSGVERFLDTPVKHYSSGMYLRLAFAVAAHLDAEILAVDEVFAVGDAEFQRRCLTKMSSLGREGRTVLFVSHDLGAITRLCRSAIWLDEGEIRAQGPASAVTEAYLSSGATPLAERIFAEGSGPVRLRSVRMVDVSGSPVTTIRREEEFSVEVRFAVRERTPDLDVTLFVENLRGIRILDEAWSEEATENRCLPPGEYMARLVVPPVLAVGDYVAGVWLGSPYETLIYEDDVLHFRLVGTDAGRPNRVAHLGLRWEVCQFSGHADTRAAD